MAMIKDEGVGRKASMGRERAQRAAANVIPVEKRRYCVWERVEPPPDVVERVSELHAQAITRHHASRTLPADRGVEDA